MVMYLQNTVSIHYIFIGKKIDLDIAFPANEIWNHFITLPNPINIFFAHFILQISRPAMRLKFSTADTQF